MDLLRIYYQLQLGVQILCYQNESSHKFDPFLRYPFYMLPICRKFDLLLESLHSGFLHLMFLAVK